MRSTDPRSVFAAVLFGVMAAWISACGSPGPEASIPASCSVSETANQVTASSPAPTGANVMPVTVNGSLCADSVDDQYPNEPCTSVQVCTPGGACATIKNLLLDTGSYGLRIYGSTLAAAGITPRPISTGAGRTLAECVGFMDGSSEWGQVAKVDLILGGKNKIANVPIHVIDHTVSSPPSHCSSPESRPDTGPESTGFVGILGVGLFEQDCGSYCTSQQRNGMYYSCNGSTCSPTTVSLANQVQNPVSMLDSDNNGVILALPGVPQAGASSVTGHLILGIDTRDNNSSAGMSRYAADSYGEFSTVFASFSASPLYSFIDSGSSLLFFPWPPPDNVAARTLIPDCEAEHPGLARFYCPPVSLSLAAQNTGDGGSATSCVGFGVGNAAGLLTNNPTGMVFSNLTGSSGSSVEDVFDWGLPFFLGRKVYVGIENRTSDLGSGPYWAY